MAVIGPSGSGKSSVVFAGLIPQLRAKKTWLIESFRPGNQPFYQLAFALVRQLDPQLGATKQLMEAVELEKKIQEGTITLQQVVSRIMERNPDKHLLLVADQFEELYTLCQEREEQRRFADTLLAAINHRSLTLVLTLRADFYGYVLSHRPFRDALQRFTPQLLSSMSREELQAAIEKPAQKLEVQLEAQLQERILDDVGQEPGNLPLLEFALTRLWEKQENQVLTHRAYNEIGGVKKALAKHAEEVYDQLNERQQRQAQRIFLQLVRLGEGTVDTRRLATYAEIGEDNWGLVTYLAGYPARLVVTGRNEQSKEETVEIVHEALIQEWKTLREWIDENRIWLREIRKMEAEALEWQNKDKSKGYLLSGTRLKEAEAWLYSTVENLKLSALAREFIQKSIGQRRNSRIQLTVIIGIIPLCFNILLAILIANQVKINSLQKTLSRSDGNLNNPERVYALKELLKAGQSLEGLNLSNIDLSRENVESIDLSSAILSKANLKGANLSGVILNEAKLEGANLSKAKLKGANLSGVILNGAELEGADLSNANLANANLSNADLKGITLRNADLSNADLTDADLTNADFRGSRNLTPNQLKSGKNWEFAIQQ